jgi:iron(III) transport system substrate-binding protein
MSVRVSSTALISVIALSTVGFIPPALAQAKKPAPPAAGATCKKAGQKAPGLVCTLDNGKLKWLASVAATTKAGPVVATTVAAKQSGDLTVLCVVQEDLCQAWTKAFGKKTGINTNFVRLSSGEAVARVGAAKANPEFDVMHGGPSDGYEAAKSQGLLEPYVSSNAAKIPAAYRDAAGNWTGVYIGVLGFCSNKQVLSRINASVPRSWNALTDAKFKSQVAMAHPSTSGTAYTAVWTQVQIWQGDVAAAFDYFKALHQNILQYTKSGSAPGTLAGRGEVATGIIFSHDCIKFQQEGFADLQVSFPVEGTGYEIGSVGIIKGAKNMANAKSYVDWTLSAEAQEIMATVKSFQIPTNPEAKVSSFSVDISSVKLVNYDDQKAGAAKKELVAKFDQQIAAAPR